MVLSLLRLFKTWSWWSKYFQQTNFNFDQLYIFQRPFFKLNSWHISCINRRLYVFILLYPCSDFMTTYGMCSTGTGNRYFTVNFSRIFFISLQLFHCIKYKQTFSREKDFVVKKKGYVKMYMDKWLCVNAALFDK